MSFLLDGKPRRRNRLPARKMPAPRSRTFSKDAANSVGGGGGQVQIQRIQHQKPRPQARIIPHQHQHHQQQDQKKKDAMQSAGVSMDDLMEDLRILGEQQRDSQRKLTQVKMLKQNRTDRRTATENQLASLKYSNGEQRAQLSRAREVLSKSTAEMESVKLEASRNDERLKATDNKLKKALMKARAHQMYCRKIEGRIISIRSRESVCQRLVTTLRSDVKSAEKTFEESKTREQHVREAIAKNAETSKTIAADTSKVRSEVVEFAEDLRCAKQMQASTKLRAQSIQAEIDTEDTHHSKETLELQQRINESRRRNTELITERKILFESHEAQNLKLHDLWNTCVTIQTEEGHEASAEPTEGGSFLSLDVELILKNLHFEDKLLSDATSESAEITSMQNLKHQELQDLQTDCTNLTLQAKKICESSKAIHLQELKRTSQHEAFLSELDKENEDVAQLRTSLAALEDGLREEHARMQARLVCHVESIRRRHEELDTLTRTLTNSTAMVDDNKNALEQEKPVSKVKLEKSKEDADASKTGFELMRAEVEALANFEDSELQHSIDEMVRAQTIMIEESNAQIKRILKDKPELESIGYVNDTTKTREERVSVTLVDLERGCKLRRAELLADQKQILSQIRQERDEKKRLAQAAEERRRKAKEEKERLLKEAAEQQRLMEEAAKRQREELILQQQEEEEEEKRRVLKAREENERKQKERKRAAERQREELIIQQQADEEKRILKAREEDERKQKERKLAAERQREELVLKQQEEEERRILKAREEDERKQKERKRAREEQRRKKAEVQAAAATESGGRKEKVVPPANHKHSSETAQALLDLGSTLNLESSTSKFNSAFACEAHDDDNEGEDLNECGDGCLTQRVGLDVPTPKSHASDNVQQSDNLRASKVHWNASVTFEGEYESTDELEDERVTANIRRNLEKEAEDREISKKGTKERRKVFGSTSADKKARERQIKEIQRMDRYASSDKKKGKSEGTKRPAGPTSPKSRGSLSLMKKRVESRDRHTAKSSTQPEKKRSIARPGPTFMSAEQFVGEKKLSTGQSKSQSRVPSAHTRQDMPREKPQSKPLRMSSSKQSIGISNPAPSNAKRTAIDPLSSTTRKKSRNSTTTQSRTENSKKIARPDKDAKGTVSVRSVASEKSRRSVSSKTSRKRARSQETASQQTSGISSGERISGKSRRRRSTDSVGKSKARSSDIPVMSDDFGFNF